MEDIGGGEGGGGRIRGCNDEGRYENNYRCVYHLQTHTEDMLPQDLAQYEKVRILVFADFEIGV